ncbi:hypothetical protein, partial [Promicromonospora kroppenstedtii]|uniref:hypothetical protein n=1 Tax=Promicromonospora kroppenstedtii TaxID=440482 RepID=UPI00055F6749
MSRPRTVPVVAWPIVLLHRMTRLLRPRVRAWFASRGSPDTAVLAERRAVLVAVLCGVLLSLTVALADAPYATGDEPPHVDYAYQVWHGDLPVFEDGLELRPDRAWLAPVQWTAQ